MVEGTILIDNRLAIVLFDPGTAHNSFCYDIQEQVMQLPYDFTVTTPLGKRVVCKLYIPQCNVKIGKVSMPVDLVILAMSNFDAIFGMDWLAKYIACIDCFCKIITFKVMRLVPVYCLKEFRKSMIPGLFKDSRLNG